MMKKLVFAKVLELLLLLALPAYGSQITTAKGKTIVITGGGGGGGGDTCSGCVHKTGDTMTGTLLMSNTSLLLIGPNGFITSQSSGNFSYLSGFGGGVTLPAANILAGTLGPLVIVSSVGVNTVGDPQVTSLSESKIIGLVADLASKVAKAGDTMTGTLLMSNTSLLLIGSDGFITSASSGNFQGLYSASLVVSGKAAVGTTLAAPNLSVAGAQTDVTPILDLFNAGPVTGLTLRNTSGGIAGIILSTAGAVFPVDPLLGFLIGYNPTDNTTELGHHLFSGGPRPKIKYNASPSVALYADDTTTSGVLTIYKDSVTVENAELVLSSAARFLGTGQIVAPASQGVIFYSSLNSRLEVSQNGGSPTPLTATVGIASTTPVAQATFSDSILAVCYSTVTPAGSFSGGTKAHIVFSGSVKANSTNTCQLGVLDNGQYITWGAFSESSTRGLAEGGVGVSSTHMQYTFDVTTPILSSGSHSFCLTARTSAASCDLSSVDTISFLTATEMP